MANVSESFQMVQNMNATAPLGSSIFLSDKDRLTTLENLDARMKAISKNANDEITNINTALATAQKNSELEACLLWQKNELLSLQMADAPMPKKEMAKIIFKKKIIVKEDAEQNAWVGPKQENIQTIKTENTVYYKPDSSAYMNRGDYTILKTEMDKLRKEVLMYREQMAKQQSAVAPVIIKRPLFGSRKKQDATNEEAFTLAIAKLRKEIQPTIIRDTIIKERIIEKPVIQYVDKIVEKPVIKYVDKIVEKNIDRPVVQYVDKIVEKQVEKIVTKSEQLLSLPPDVILFDVGKSLIRQQYYSRLNYYATQLSKFPELGVTLSGYTDNTGNAASNQRLSEVRAAAVKAYLIKKGVAASKISTNFDGANNPVAANSGANNKQQNRRVEINFNK